LSPGTSNPMIDAGMADTRQEQDVKADKLGHQVDGLLDHMEAAADDVARELMGEPPSTLHSPAVPDPLPKHDIDTIPQPADTAPTETKPEIDTTPQPADSAPTETEPEIDTTPEPADSAPTEPEIDTTPEPVDAVPAEPEIDTTLEPADTAPTEPEAAKLDEQVGKLVDDAIDSSDQPSMPVNIDSLDDELAALANDLLAGDSAPIEGAVTEAGIEQPEPVRSPKPDARAEPEAIPEQPAETKAPVPEPAAVPAAPIAAETVEDPKPAPQKSNAAKNAALSATIKAVEFTGRPLANRSTGLRQTVGWIAIVTLFNATMAWGYVLFIREPVQPVGGDTPTRLTVPHDTAPATPASSSK